jgi:hypothetical protein
MMIQKTILRLMESGIPCRLAKFHSAVDNAYRVPESYFSFDDQNKNRKADLWYTTTGLLCRQLDPKGEGIFFIVPLSNVIFAHAMRIDHENQLPI